MMKKSIFSLVCFCGLVVVFMYGCRKKELVAETGELVTKPKHCFDQILNFDETTVDAGGSCGSNDNPLESSCFFITGDSALIEPYEYKIDSCAKKINQNDELVFTMYFSAGTIKIIVNQNVDYGYELNYTSSNPSPSEYACIVNDYHYGPQNLIIGKVRIITNGVDFAVEICEGAFYPPGFGDGKSVNAFAKVK
jgi:hypothetical protein